jgi:hypothetical protein
LKGAIYLLMPYFTHTYGALLRAYGAARSAYETTYDASM